MSSSTWGIIDNFLKETREDVAYGVIYRDMPEMERAVGRGVVKGIDNLMNLKVQLEGFDNKAVEEYKRSRGEQK